ncbi:phosphotransferase [Pelagibacterium sp. 26DY04]|uniref:phosphotransferase n=1 Tax=Pelagibacterium sp. 26DY04 TaxID=2967130 RepID=UPI002814AF3F|nr:phosphotransferase [Pelagibacterium sp. 26DY04]WMT87878.1 phosphotransferase [Pelagibacterium sp. 26DY04]
MHQGQIEYDLTRVECAVGEQFPHLRGKTITRLVTPGTTNAIFRVGCNVAARFPLRPDDPERHAATLHDEALAMREFGLHCRVETPQPLGIGTPGPGIPLAWSLQTWIEGAVVTPDSHANSETFAADLGTLVRALRAADLRGRQFAGTGRGGHLPDHDRWMAECFEKSAGLLDVDRLRQMWRRFRALPGPTRFTMSHKDLIPPNLLADGDHLAGVLDIGGFGPADAALDLVVAWHTLNERCRSLFRGIVNDDPIEWKRGAAWAFQQAMGLAWYYRETNPAMSALGRSTLARLLADPEVGGV